MADLNDLAGGASGNGGDEEDNHRKDDSPKKIYETPLKRDSRKPSRRHNKTSSSSPGEESCSEATAVTSMALTPMTVGSLASTGSETHHQIEVDVQREQLQHQMMLLSFATTVTLAMFILTTIPLVTLLTFSLLATSSGLLSYTAFQRLVLEIQNMARDGFGRYLPAAMVSLLTNQSLHQFLRDDTFVREWGFLALYFVPGLTEDQLNDYLRRLAPDRQVLLNRRGMGHFLGDGFMRALEGERRWRQDAIGPVSNVPPTIEHPNQELVVRSRGLELDFSDGESHASAPVELIVATREGSVEPDNNNGDDDDDDRQRQLAEEGDVVLSALWDGFSSYVSWGAGLAGQFTYNQVLEPATEMATNLGLVGSIGVTVLSLGAGLWQYSRPTTGTISQQSSSRTPSRLLMSTTILGGLSTGVMLYARSALRKSVRPPAPGKPQPK